MDYAKLIKEKKVVKEFPEKNVFGVIKAAARELLDNSEYGKIYKIGPVKKDKPLHGMRKHIVVMAAKANFLVTCRTTVLEDGGYLFFKKEKPVVEGQEDGKGRR